LIPIREREIRSPPEVSRELRSEGYAWHRRFPACLETSVAKEQLLEFEGVITEALPEGRFRVRLANEHELIAYTGGRMKKNRIRALVGDRVSIEVSPYDLSKGRLTFRHKMDSEMARAGAKPQRRLPFRR